MEFNEINSNSINLITAYGEGYLEVNHKKTTENILIYPEHTYLMSEIKTIDDIDETILNKAIDFDPEIILFGFNATNHFLPRHQIKLLHKNQIAVECMNLMSACRTFNILLSEQRRVIFFALTRL